MYSQFMMHGQKNIKLGCYVGTFIALTLNFITDCGMKLIVCEYLIFYLVTGCFNNKLWLVCIPTVYLQPPVISK